jgi:hypothetical protein
MKSRLITALLAAVLSQAAFADNDTYWNNVDGSFATMLETKQTAPLPTGDYWANVSGSFDAMLNHEPYYGETAVTVARGAEDPVETLLHAMVRGDDRPVRVRGIDLEHDSVAAAFGRMLKHTPYAGETATTVARQKDYRVDRLVQAMRHARGTEFKVAGK